MTMFIGFNPQAVELAGAIPHFLNSDDPRPAAQQFDEHYVGGWRPFQGHTFDPETGLLHYPEEGPLEPFAVLGHHEELIYIYPYAWVCIVQPDDTYEIARMD